MIGSPFKNKTKTPSKKQFEKIQEGVCQSNTLHNLVGKNPQKNPQTVVEIESNKNSDEAQEINNAQGPSASIPTQEDAKPQTRCQKMFEKHFKLKVGGIVALAIIVITLSIVLPIVLTREKYETEQFTYEGEKMLKASIPASQEADDDSGILVEARRKPTYVDGKQKFRLLEVTEQGKGVKKYQVTVPIKNFFMSLFSRKQDKKNRWIWSERYRRNKTSVLTQIKNALVIQFEQKNADSKSKFNVQSINEVVLVTVFFNKKLNQFQLRQVSTRNKGNRKPMLRSQGPDQTNQYTNQQTNQDDLGEKVASQDESGQDAVNQDDLGEKVASQDESGQDAANQDDLGEKVASQDESGEDAANKDDLGEKVASQDESGEDAANQDDLGEKVERRQKSSRKPKKNKKNKTSSQLSNKNNTSKDKTQSNTNSTNTTDTKKPDTTNPNKPDTTNPNKPDTTDTKKPDTTNPNKPDTKQQNNKTSNTTADKAEKKNKTSDNSQAQQKQLNEIIKKSVDKLKERIRLGLKRLAANLPKVKKIQQTLIKKMVKNAEWQKVLLQQCEVANFRRNSFVCKTGAVGLLVKGAPKMEEDKVPAGWEHQRVLGIVFTETTD